MDCPKCEAQNFDSAESCVRCGAPLTVEYVDFSIRFVAWVVDYTIVLVSTFVFVVEGLEEVALVIGFGYMVLFTGLRGQTLGKMFVGIRVIKPGRATPGLGTAFLREVVGKIVSIIPFGAGLLWVNRDRWGQGWHDKLAGTYVIRPPRQPLGPNQQS